MKESSLGYYIKYHIEKTDGTPVDPNASYFVLRIDKDIHAARAAMAYAKSCADTNVRLSDDLRRIIADHFPELAQRDQESITLATMLSAHNVFMTPLEIYTLARVQQIELVLWCNMRDASRVVDNLYGAGFLAASPPPSWVPIESDEAIAKTLYRRWRDGCFDMSMPSKLPA